MIPSKGKAVFLLSYEELLHRRLGKYEHVVSVRPQQLVGRLTVEVNILERAGLSSLEVLPPQDTRQRHGGRAEGECPPSGGRPRRVVPRGRALALERSVDQMAALARLCQEINKC